MHTFNDLWNFQDVNQVLSFLRSLWDFKLPNFQEPVGTLKYKLHTAMQAFRS